MTMMTPNPIHQLTISTIPSNSHILRLLTKISQNLLNV
ncbi:hypothetical protein CPT_MyoSmar_004 [Serratia phage MyoSmar]|uniref:Uncharacterized protein n=1 Tax=Serratia phage MyoSmar TaxID=2596673 RepID=A0A5B9NF60_9CAUD|nr:hypothetical protein HWC56_gp004 [Serratia phage MyoSmar]QEG09453.1 hypothetical protein CPT_MyoSmar_004 [Serratia phage MyoSmar]